MLSMVHCLYKRAVKNFLKTCSLLIRYSVINMSFLCAITYHYMSLRVHYVIYNRLNNVYIETDSQVWI